MLNNFTWVTVFMHLQGRDLVRMPRMHVCRNTV